MNYNNIILPATGFPAEEGNLRELLSPLLPDVNLLNCIYENGYWRILIARHSFDYCEDMSASFSEFGITSDKALNYFIAEDNFCFSFLESWILYGLSKFFSEHKIDRSRKITFIHLDDHTDLMSPNVKVDSLNNWIDLITGKVINFQYPETIQMAIQSSAVGIGSAFTPFFHYFNKMSILHLKCNADCKKLMAAAAYSTNNLLWGKNARILSIEFASHASGNYIITDKPSRLLEYVEDDNSPIVLHIDMDYFNNRYNGNTDWHLEKQGWNPDFNVQCVLIDNFINAIEEKRIQKRIVYIAIGVSPSFYPCEYWHDGISYLLNQLCKIGISLHSLRKKLKMC